MFRWRRVHVRAAYRIVVGRIARRVGFARCIGFARCVGIAITEGVAVRVAVTIPIPIPISVTLAHTDAAGAFDERSDDRHVARLGRRHRRVDRVPRAE